MDPRTSCYCWWALDLPGFLNYLLVLMTRLVLNLYTAYSDVGGTDIIIILWAWTLSKLIWDDISSLFTYRIQIVKYCNYSSLFSCDERRSIESIDRLAHTPFARYGFPQWKSSNNGNKLFINCQLYFFLNLRMSGIFVQGLLILGANACSKDNTLFSRLGRGKPENRCHLAFCDTTSLLL